MQGRSVQVVVWGCGAPPQKCPCPNLNGDSYSIRFGRIGEVCADAAWEQCTDELLIKELPQSKTAIAHADDQAITFG